MRKYFVILLAGISFGITPSITSFNTGQVSPLMEARADFQKYSSSCRVLENMLVTVQGPVLKRPGTKYIATAKEGNPRLLPFEYSTDDAYIIEMGNLYARFYRDGGQILQGEGQPPVEIVTPYATGGFFDIQYAQTDNSLYLADGTNPPQIITRTSHTDWTIEEIDFTTGPFLPENETAITITPSGSTGGITLTASSSIFQSTAGASHVGSIWSIKQVRESSTLEGTFTGNRTTENSPRFTGGYSFSTTGNSDGTITLQRSTNDSISFSPALESLTDTDFDNPAEFEEDGAVYRVVMSSHGGGTPTYTFTITDNRNKGVVKITTVGSGTVAGAIVITDLVDTSATTQWREGYWSDYRGWPETVSFHQQRLVYGGSTFHPQAIWFGKQDPDDYENFLEGTLDTSAFTAALVGQNPIRWMLSQDYLLIGTSGSCGKWGEQGRAVTPTSPNYQDQTRHGAAGLQAIVAGDEVMYIERGARNVRQFGFDLQADKYLSPDLTLLSPEITESGITDTAFQFRPGPVLWCVMADGEIATLTYRRDQSVSAWTKQITDGDFKSVAVISSGDEADEVWVSVERTIGGSAVGYIEQFQPVDWGNDDDDSWFVDSGSAYDGGAAITVTGATQADPGVITAVSHGFSNGDQVLFSSVGGMIELNGRVYTVAASATDTFALKDVTGTWDYDTSGFTAYTSGGSVQQVEDSFGNLDYLEGETVKVYADGIILSDEVVVGGEITIDVHSNIVLAGLPFTAKLETLPIRVDPFDYVANKKIKRLWLDLYKTGDCLYGAGPTADLTPINFWQEATLTAKVDLYTSTIRPKQVAFPYAGYVKQTVLLESSEPVSLGVRSIIVEMESGSR